MVNPGIMKLGNSVNTERKKEEDIFSEFLSKKVCIFLKLTGLFLEFKFSKKILTLTSSSF
jgi:hypothetical protein